MSSSGTLLTNESLPAGFGLSKLEPQGDSRGASYGAAQRVRTAAARHPGDRGGLDGATAARAQGVSRATGYKWVRRYRPRGSPGSPDRSSRPHHSPSRTPAAEVGRILAARAELRWGPDRLGPLLGCPASTVAAVLRRAGAPRLADIDRPTGIPVRRYEACHPGALVHQDHKKLGRIPDGGGHRVLGRAAATRREAAGRLGYDHFEVIVDDRSRRAVVVQVPDESGESAARALAYALACFAADGIEVERVMTDNGWAYRSNGLPRRPGPRAATAGPGPIARRPTARPSGSSGRSSASGRTPGCTPPTRSAWRRCRASSTSTIDDARTPRSADSHPWPSSTTSLGITARGAAGGREPRDGDVERACSSPPIPRWWRRAQRRAQTARLPFGAAIGRMPYRISAAAPAAARPRSGRPGHAPVDHAKPAQAAGSRNRATAERSATHSSSVVAGLERTRPTSFSRPQPIRNSAWLASPSRPSPCASAAASRAVRSTWAVRSWRPISR